MTEISSPRQRHAAAFLAVLLSLITAAATVPVAAQGATTSGTTTISLKRTIKTTPFVRSRVSMEDNEGSAYVPRDNSLWLVDDNGQRIYEVNPRTGVLKRTISSKALESVRRFRGTAKAGTARSRDLESLAYDAATDRLYAFSGGDCKPSAASCRWVSRPTAFRLSRVSGRLRLHSFQPLRRASDATAAAWNSRNRRLYVGNGSVIRTYNYNRNSFGPRIGVANLDDILGMDFTPNGAGLLITRSESRLSRVHWRTKSLGATRDLSRFGVRDARAVALVRGRLFVSDGYDYRRVGNRLRYAVFVFELTS